MGLLVDIRSRTVPEGPLKHVTVLINLLKKKDQLYFSIDLRCLFRDITHLCLNHSPKTIFIVIYRLN